MPRYIPLPGTRFKAHRIVDHPAHSRQPSRHDRDRSGLRHEGRSGDDARIATPTTAATYYFCSRRLPQQIHRRPGKISARRGRCRRRPRSPEGTIYTCPMHPQIRQVGPGSCPICGMALEPEAGGEDDGGELADMTRRFWLSAVLALPVVVLEMGGASVRLRAVVASVSALDAVRCWRRRWCCGAAGRSSCAARDRCARATSTCSR